MALRRISLAVWLSLCIAPAVAATAQTPGDRELIRERQERLLQEQQRRLEELQQLPGKVEPAPLKPGVEARCFEVRHIRIWPMASWR